MNLGVSNWEPTVVAIIGIVLVCGLAGSLWKAFVRYRQRYSTRISIGLSFLKLLLTIVAIVCYGFVSNYLKSLIDNSFPGFFRENSYAGLADLILLFVVAYEARRWFDRRVLSSEHSEFEIAGVSK